MPAEITLPLTKLEQAVADARAHEQVMAAKVEDAKLVLKSAKTAWEEAVGEVFRAIDEMIADKRQPSLFSDRDADDTTGTTNGGPSDPNPPAPAGEPPACEVVNVEIISPEPAVYTPSLPDLAMLPPAVADEHGPSWRKLVVAEQLDGPGELFDTLSAHGVMTMGALADALLASETFGLKLIRVNDLMEAIEDVSQEDERPIRFTPREDDDKADSDALLGNITGTVHKGEPIDRLGLSEATLNAAVATVKLAGVRWDHSPIHLPTVNLNERLHVVTLHAGRGEGGDVWYLRPLWTQEEFVKRHPAGAGAETAQRDPEFGVKVHLHAKKKKQDVFLIGAKGEERKLIQAAAVEPAVEPRTAEEEEKEPAPASTLGFDDL